MKSLEEIIAMNNWIVSKEDLQGRWLLTAPDGRIYRGPSPEECVKLARASHPSLLTESAHKKLRE